MSVGLVTLKPLLGAWAFCVTLDLIGSISKQWPAPPLRRLKGETMYRTRLLSVNEHEISDCAGDKCLDFLHGEPMSAYSVMAICDHEQAVIVVLSRSDGRQSDTIVWAGPNDRSNTSGTLNRLRRSHLREILRRDALPIHPAMRYDRALP
jgi:hypothetical protein